MWTSSTATPAATDGAAPGGVAKKTSRGRSRLPPALSASRETAETTPVVGANGLARGAPRAPRGTGRDRASRGWSPARSFRRPPRVQRDDTAREAAATRRRRSRPRAAARPARRARGSGERSPAGTCRRPRPSAACRAAGRRGRTRRGRTARSAPRGVVISRIPSRPPGSEHAPQLAAAPGRGRRRCGRRSRPSPPRTSRPRRAARADRPPATRSPAPCAARARASAARSRGR